MTAKLTVRRQRRRRAGGSSAGGGRAMRRTPAGKASGATTVHDRRCYLEKKMLKMQTKPTMSLKKNDMLGLTSTKVR